MIHGWMHKQNSLLKLIPAVCKPICIALAMFLAVAQSVVNIAEKGSVTNSHNIHISPGGVSSSLVLRSASGISFSWPISPCSRRGINLLSVSIPLWWRQNGLKNQAYMFLLPVLEVLRVRKERKTKNKEKKTNSPKNPPNRTVYKAPKSVSMENFSFKGRFPSLYGRKTYFVWVPVWMA